VDKITVVHIITKLELGGAQQNTLFTVAHLDRDRYEPVLISGADGMLVDEARHLTNVRLFLVPELVREIRPLKDLTALFKIARILRTMKRSVRDKAENAAGAVIVHTHSSKAGILGRWAAWLAGIRCIIHTVHGFSFHQFQPRLTRAVYVFLERLTASITSAFILVSRANMEEGIREKIFIPDKALLIRSGIDISEYRSVQCDRMAVRAALGITNGAPLVAMVACFKPQKAPLDFVKTARLVLAEYPQAEFLMVGDGELRSRIEALADELNIADRVHLVGWRKNVPQIMHAIDLLVLTSLWEGLPRVLPQAMAAGVPVVASDVNGSREVISDGINGFLAQPHDVQDMARKILYLLTHPEEARVMGRNGTSMVQEFDIWKMLRQQEDLYAYVSGSRFGDHCGRRP
jgi:glycosyltransferase involved in cell wall biosynthesis